MFVTHIQRRPLAQLLYLLCALVMLLPSLGCNTFKLRGGLVQELESENERLLSEYRAERERRELAEKQVHDMETKLAASEKLVAQRYSPIAARTPSTTPYNFAPPVSGDLNGLGDRYQRPYGNPEPNSGLRWQSRTGQ